MSATSYAVRRLADPGTYHFSDKHGISSPVRTRHGARSSESSAMTQDHRQPSRQITYATYGGSV